MPDVRNCRKCGKIYNYIGGAPLCPSCKELDEADFKRIKEYLYDNPKASVTQVSVDLDVSVEKIKRFLKEGRLEIAGDDGNLILECENCGRSIKTGRYCVECERSLTSSLRSAASQFKSELESQSQNTGRSNAFGMRYLNKSYEKKD
ncbi:MAG: MerR family transcriptional regulator [Clostridiaceae bacterium]|jgi:flagellar operon protein (TIGR03826 family)|nr:MerR family transcriptional regulator [Clostridiaceae bacterium]